MGREVVILLCALLVSGCYDSFDEFSPSASDSDGFQQNCTIEHIHTLYNDSGCRNISQELIIEGVVTANDNSGNFYRSFIIESDGYAIEILDGLYDSYVRFPLGATIALRLSGMSLDRDVGVLRTGLTADANSYFDLEYLTSEAIVDEHIKRLEVGNEPSPRLALLSEMSESSAGEFRKIENLTLHTDLIEEQVWSGYQLFRDRNNDSIWCHTSEYASFAQSTIPTTAVSLSGIIEYGDTDNETDRLIIKLRQESDCTP